MDDSDSYWTAVRATRLRIADLLEELAPAEWEQESLCRGWRVRDVAGHLALVPTITTWDMVAVAPRARFSPDRINTVLARRHGSRAPAELVTAIRNSAGSRRTAKALDTRNALFDAIVHGQDIALPLTRRLPVPAEHSREGLRRVWEMGWPFHAKRHLAGFTLRATDTDWSAGDGPEIAGPALALLLLLTGRTACLDALRGDGADRLKSSSANH
ncbi:maleylpyruvate isomerase family mycothiol-dependent enzyme [Streptomyces sp. NPDC057298]|uniref:maleylpyruvate isomerase family mycothiol-dependent enzyme n=1 Tax=Streptomyces sp. NPDC057298 TaxID=3346091 RepID=UPI0036417B32